MFVGHYGVSFAAKKYEASIPLWALFVAVQLLDVAWAPFVLLGIEKVRIVPGITASNPLDLYYMPYTHSLVAALLWSAAAFAVWRLVRPRAGMTAALIVAVAVFSHWVLDFVVHRPDLPLYDNSAKVGLGLWNLPALAFGLEAALLLGGAWLYLLRGHGVAARPSRSASSCSRSRPTSSSDPHRSPTRWRPPRPSELMRCSRVSSGGSRGRPARACSPSRAARSSRRAARPRRTRHPADAPPRWVKRNARRAAS